MASAELCFRCDLRLSEGYNPTNDGQRAGKSTARSEEFLHLITLTNIARFERGSLKCG